MKRIFVILLLLSLLIGCGRNDKPKDGTKLSTDKPPSWGHNQVIYVFADDTVWNSVEKYLRYSLEREEFTTENEPWFAIKRVDINDMERYYRFANLLFLGHLRSADKVSSYLTNKLGESYIRQVKESGSGLFSRENLWSNDQIAVFLITESGESMPRFNYEKANDIFDQFQKKLYQRMRRRAYLPGIHEKSDFRNLPWFVKLPKNYKAYREDRDDRAMAWLARLGEQPDRYFGVYYEKLDEKPDMRTWGLAARKKFAWDTYDEDVFDPDQVRTRSMRIDDHDALKIAGPWKNDKFYVGGAFQSYVLYDDATSTAFLVDNSIYYPEGYKLTTLIELEEISKTFHVKHPEGSPE